MREIRTSGSIALKCDQPAKFVASISCGAATARSLAGSALMAVAAAAPRNS
jgi:hypothetical protein